MPTPFPLNHRVRSSCCWIKDRVTRQSLGNAERLEARSSRHPLPLAGLRSLGADAGPSPLSRSVSTSEFRPRGMCIAGVGDSSPVSSARVWTSSSAPSESVSDRGMAVLPCVKERTTSPLHMGQVRRRVVSQGVLGTCKRTFKERLKGLKTYMHST